MAQPKYKFKDLVKDGKAIITNIGDDKFKIEYKRHDVVYGTPLLEGDEETVEQEILEMEIKRLEEEKAQLIASHDERIEWLKDQISEIKKNRER